MMQWRVLFSIKTLSIVCDNKNTTHCNFLEVISHGNIYISLIYSTAYMCSVHVQRSITYFFPIENDIIFFSHFFVIAIFFTQVYTFLNFVNDIKCNDGFKVCVWFRWKYLFKKKKTLIFVHSVIMLKNSVYLGKKKKNKTKRARVGKMWPLFMNSRSNWLLQIIIDFGLKSNKFHVGTFNTEFSYEYTHNKNLLKCNWMNQEWRKNNPKKICYA